MTRRASTRILAMARALEHLAELYPDAVEYLAHLEAQIDGWSQGSEVHVRASAALTTVEAAADRRLQHALDRADIESGVHLLHVTIDDLLRSCHAALRTSGRKPEGPRLCDPSGREGSLVPLAEGGWADWTCRDAATKAGLCARHYMAERRWRAANGLAPRDEQVA